MRKVTIYSTKFCPFCIQAKRLLETKAIAYEDKDLTQDIETRERLSAETGQQTVPMIFIGDEFVGGYQELAALESSGALNAKVNDE